MRIGVEANTYYKNRAGSGVYTRNIVNIWLNSASGNTIRLFASNRLSEMDLSKKKNNFRRLLNGLSDILWMQIVLPIRLAKEHADVLFCPTFIGPVFSRVPAVVSILDMSFMRFPEYSDFLFKIYLRFMMPLIKKRARGIITISNFSKREIVELLHIPEEKVKVIMLGCGEIFRPINDQSLLDQVRNDYARGTRFILNIGTLEPRKNIVALLEAFALLKRKPDFSHKLLLCGGKGWYYDQIFTKVNKLKLEDDVIFIGYLPEEKLPLLYNAADVFVFPSFYEGFGLPVLEAMSCGCPVITSNCSSLPEVAGDGALLIDPHVPEEIAEAMEKVISNTVLRNDLILKGLKQANKFSWKITAEATLEYLTTIAKVG